MLKIFNCYSINNNIFYRINNEMLLEETEENIQYNEVPSSSSNWISNGLNIKSFKYEWLTKFNWLIYDNEKK